jgi:hypothetical protein
MRAAVSATLRRGARGIQLVGGLKNPGIDMISSHKGTTNIRSGASSSVGVIHGDCFARGSFDSRRPKPEGPSEVSALNGVDGSLVVSSKKLPRILLVDAALALHELHLELLRSIPALVEKLVSCADMYLHEENAYALVILVLQHQAGETAEVAHFVRHRWSAARILLLESESAVIDDWLYDERVDPHPHPAAVRDAAIRLMTEEKYWVPA